MAFVESRAAWIAAIHAQNWGTVVAVTGGGSLALSDLLTVSGASRTVLEAVVPYASEALVDFLHARPETWCSEATARSMAMAAFQRAVALGSRENPPRAVAQTAGVACTASLASDRPKRGEHRLHVALQTALLTRSWSLTLSKGARSRAAEERLAADIVLTALGEAAGVSGPGYDLLADEAIQSRTATAQPGWSPLVLGIARRAAGNAAARRLETAPSVPLAPLLFPGAFNPLHDGHRRMAAIAAEMQPGPVAWEISLANVDKPPLDFVEMEARSQQFQGDEALWFTRAPLFGDKAAVFPGSTFVVGIDTVRRLVDARYYAGGEADMRDVLAGIARAECRFLVFGRKVGDTFQTLRDVVVPDVLRPLCIEVPEARFREDISSTELRRAQRGE